MKKLLIWDLDNTLWQGTLLEGDLCPIPLDHIEIINTLRDRGVLQSIASYNLEKDVMERLAESGLDNEFLYPEIHWNDGVDKAMMVNRIVGNLGLSRFSDVVFVDDQDFNRAEVLNSYPEVNVIHPDQLSWAFDEYFTKEFYTEEDRLRVRRYQQEAVRRNESKAYGQDRIGFLKSCEIKMEICTQPNKEEMQRILDLLIRANQMSAINSTFEMKDIQEKADDILFVKVSDKFGDYGISAVCIAHPEDNSTIIIDALVVSCRLQGKGIGSALVAWVYNYNAMMAYNTVARWRETVYNLAIRDLYHFLGFTCSIINGDKDVIAVRHWSQGELSYPEWLTIKKTGGWEAI